MSIVTKVFKDAVSQPIGTTESFSPSERSTLLENNRLATQRLYDMVNEKKIGVWEKVNKPRYDGIIVEFSFGEASFLAGDTNSKLENLIHLLEGRSLRNVSATVVLKQGERPNGRELCLSCPVALRAKISSDKLPRQDIIDDAFRSEKRNYQTEITEISLADVTHIGLFAARQESVAQKWASQFNLLKDLLVKSLSQGS
jgi:hypothetical protein